MSDNTVLVSTRKGLFVVERATDSWNIAQHAFPGDNIALTSIDPRDGSWYAVLDLGHFGNKLQRSTDRGRTWSECAASLDRRTNSPGIRCQQPFLKRASRPTTSG